MVERSLTTRIINVLSQRFPGAALNIGAENEASRISGWIIWSGFEGSDQVDRQRQLREALTPIPDDDRRLLGPILTMTPGEVAEDEEAA